MFFSLSKLKAARIAAGLNHEKAALLLPKDGQGRPRKRSTYSNKERGAHPITIQELELLAAGFGCDLADFFELVPEGGSQDMSEWKELYLEQKELVRALQDQLRELKEARALINPKERAR